MEDQETYHIEVEGRISTRWAHWFDDMTLTVHQEGEAPVVTTLTGAVADQAALLGLLQKLYTLGLPLLQVRRKETPGNQDSASSMGIGKPHVRKTNTEGSDDEK